MLTYSFNPLFFERIVLPELWAGETGDVLVVADANQLKNSLQRWEGQLRYLGRRYQLVKAMHYGAFHPKIMVRLGQEEALIWIGSGNISDGGWGENREIGSAWQVGVDHKDDGKWLGSLLNQVQEICPSLHIDLIGEALHQDWLKPSNEMKKNDGPIRISYGNKTLSRILLDSWEGRSFHSVRILTGSTDSKAAFVNWLGKNFGITRAKIFVDEENSSFVEKDLLTSPMDIDVVHEAGSPPMHAKLYWFDGEDGPAAIMGSANCSAAAWLVPPAHGGNIEAISIYDNPKEKEFASILSLFDRKGLKEVSLTGRDEHDRSEENPKNSIQDILDITWESTVGRIRVLYGKSIAHDTNVLLNIDGKDHRLDPWDEKRCLWGRSNIDVGMGVRETLFCTVVVEDKRGRKKGTLHWINDLSELKQSSKIRLFASALVALEQRQTASEQQRILTQLQRISNALLSENQDFPDAFYRDVKIEEAKNAANQKIEAVDPDRLIKSIQEVDLEKRSSRHREQRSPITLIGIMRALFELDDHSKGLEEEECSNGAEVDDTKEESKKESKGSPKGRAKWPEDRVRKRLADQVDSFLSNYGKQSFADQCTVMQFIQATAFPLAVSVLGAKGGWVNSRQAQEWVVKVLDVLFHKEYTGGNIGLMGAVGNRYAAKNAEYYFTKTTGDGTLWISLLNVLVNLPWEKSKAPFLRALYLKEIYHCKSLIASSSIGRMQGLIDSIKKDKARKIVKLAPEAADLISRIEAKIKAQWEDLLSNQEEEEIIHEVGDLLWRPEIGWAEVLDKACWNENTNVYLHFRASEKKVAKGYYVNVSRLMEKDGELEKLMEEASTLGQ
ncbi:phospholipase D-like domain-containing protein [bacterium]|nr:phospholipase D-like domain-containing protein [bacterium]